MSNPWIVIGAILAIALLYVLLPRVTHILALYRATRKLECPETGKPARLDIDASHAALTSVLGEPRLRVRWCNLWPARKDCGQECTASPDMERPAEQDLADSR